MVCAVSARIFSDAYHEIELYDNPGFASVFQEVMLSLLEGSRWLMSDSKLNRKIIILTNSQSIRFGIGGDMVPVGGAV